MLKAADLVRDVKDFPKPGIVFKDITPVLRDAEATREVIEALAEAFSDVRVDVVAAVEARGFIFGACLAQKLAVGFVPIRKKGKLPYKTLSCTYDLEYGQDTIEMHCDAVSSGDNVLLIDDLLATGGTMAAAAKLIEQAGGKVAGIGFFIELTFLNGREKLKNYRVVSLVKY